MGEIKGKTGAEIIRGILEEKHISQRQLAKMMGVTDQRISQALNDRMGNMRFDRFHDMCDVLGYEVTVKEK